MEFGYFYQNEPEQFAFYRIPRVLFTDDRFKNLTGNVQAITDLCEEFYRPAEITVHDL